MGPNNSNVTPVRFIKTNYIFNINPNEINARSRVLCIKQPKKTNYKRNNQIYIKQQISVDLIRSDQI